MKKLKHKKLFLLDMDGTLYLGNRLLDGTLEFLRHIRSIGGTYMFLTNNSSKSVKNYVEKLAQLGISAQQEEFMTSAQATLLYLQKEYPNKKIYVFGTRSFQRELEEGGIHVVNRREEGIHCIVMGFDTELTFQKLEDACILLTEGVDFVATNPDWVCPTEFGYVPDCGSVSEMLYRATSRKPKFIGKPEPQMVYLAMEKGGFSPEETVLIGDRIYTDIASGHRANVDTILVMSGETTEEDVKESEIKPTFIFRDVKEVMEKMI